MEKYLFAILLSLLPVHFALAKTSSLFDRLKGRILLQVQAKGQAWYVDPESGTKRVALSDPETALNFFRADSKSIKNQDLTKIKIDLSTLSGIDKDNDGLPDDLEKSIGTDFTQVDTDGDGYSDKVELANGYDPLGNGRLVFDSNIANKYKGWALVQTESKNEIWYVDPVGGQRYLLNNATAVSRMIRKLGLGINNSNLNLIKEVKVEIPKISLANKENSQDLLKIQETIDNFAQAVNQQDVDLFLKSVGSSFRGTNYSKDDNEKIKKSLAEYTTALGSKEIKFTVMPEISQRQYSGVYFVRVNVYLDGKDVTVNADGKNSIVVKYENNIWKIIDMEVEFKTI